MAFPIQNLGANPFNLAAQEIAGRLDLANAQGASDIAKAQIMANAAAREAVIKGGFDLSKQGLMNQGYYNTQGLQERGSNERLNKQLASYMELQKQKQAFDKGAPEWRLGEAKLKAWGEASPEVQARAFGLGKQPWEMAPEERAGMLDWEREKKKVLSPLDQSTIDYNKAKSDSLLAQAGLKNPAYARDSELSKTMVNELKISDPKRHGDIKAKYADAKFEAGLGFGLIGLPLVKAGFTELMDLISTEQDVDKVQRYAKTYLSNMKKLNSRVGTLSNMKDRQEMNQFYYDANRLLYETLAKRRITVGEVENSKPLSERKGALSQIWDTPVPVFKELWNPDFYRGVFGLNSQEDEEEGY